MAFTLITGGMPPVQSRSLVPPQPRPEPPRATITRRDIRGTPVRQVGWVDYLNGRGRILQAVQHPRLRFLTRMWEEDGQSRTFWIVDGATVEGLDEAVEALNLPPVLTAEEAEVLDLVPFAWTKPTALRAAITLDLPIEAHGPRVRILRSLADKGLVEVEDNQIRRSAGDMA